MPQHWSILFLQDIAANVDSVVGIYTEDVAIEGAVMNAAEGEPVWNFRSAALVAIRQDVRRVEQFAMSQAADRAALFVRNENQLAEAMLVEADLHGGGGVSAPDRENVELRRDLPDRSSRGVDGDFKCEILRSVANDVAGEQRLVHALCKAVEVDEWSALGHRPPHGDVRPGRGIGSLIPVLEYGVGRDLIVVARLTAGTRRRSNDGKGGTTGAELARAPDPHLAIPELDAVAFKLESRVEIVVGDDSAALATQFFEAGEGGEAQIPIVVGHALEDTVYIAPRDYLGSGGVTGVA